MPNRELFADNSYVGQTAEILAHKCSNNSLDNLSFVGQHLPMAMTLTYR